VTSLPLLAQIAAAVTIAIPANSPLTPALVAQIQQSPGHYHEGELGQKFLLLEQSLKCNCGCGLDVHSCQFQMQCGTSPDWSQRIRRDLEAGLTPEAIQASFVAEYGPTVLMSPPPEGFNLVGYFLPALAIVSAGAAVLLVIRAGGGRKEELAPVAAPTDAEQARLAAELRKLEEAESPDW
jgi:cytochrome c-type biogenesis protein CcmH/NrfF